MVNNTSNTHKAGKKAHFCICSTGDYAHTYAKQGHRPHSTVGAIHFLCNVPRNRVNFKRPNGLVTPFRVKNQARVLISLAYAHTARFRFFGKYLFC